ncbi:hypothetical protein EPI10_020476 [Gossypium australe]|uniref:Copia protein n=1 Tax=Gossypium australe TaxID=47621 RepID=A0A5B6WGN2_9ROSI|nr:hypothetical protein EPI10_020476 [Gossypium australe]
MDHGLLFTPSSKLGLQAYTDENWGTDVDDRRSTTRFCVFFGGNLISWSSRKQQVVSKSIAEAEYRSLAHAIVELIWLQALLKELRVNVTNNSSAIAIATNPVLHLKFEHVELDLFFFREKIIVGTLKVGHVPSQDQVADILTKPLSTIFFNKFRDQL